MGSNKEKYVVLAEAQDNVEEYKSLFGTDAQYKRRCFIEEINIYFLQGSRDGHMSIVKSRFLRWPDVHAKHSMRK
jgi:hypothetical protein